MISPITFGHAANIHCEIVLRKSATYCGAVFRKMDEARTGLEEKSSVTVAPAGFSSKQTFAFAKIGSQFRAAWKMIYFGFETKVVFYVVAESSANASRVLADRIWQTQRREMHACLEAWDFGLPFAPSSK